MREGSSKREGEGEGGREGEREGGRGGRKGEKEKEESEFLHLQLTSQWQHMRKKKLHYRLTGDTPHQLPLD